MTLLQVGTYEVLDTLSQAANAVDTMSTAGVVSDNGESNILIWGLTTLESILISTLSIITLVGSILLFKFRHKRDKTEIKKDTKVYDKDGEIALQEVVNLLRNSVAEAIAEGRVLSDANVELYRKHNEQQIIINKQQVDLEECSNQIKENEEKILIINDKLRKCAEVFNELESLIDDQEITVDVLNTLTSKIELNHE